MFSSCSFCYRVNTDKDKCFCLKGDAPFAPRLKFDALQATQFSRIMHSLATLCSLVLLALGTSSSPLDDVVFVIHSQSDPYHAAVAEKTKELLEKSLLSAGASSPFNIFLTHKDSEIRSHGAWTYFPAVEAVVSMFGEDGFDWLVFLEEDAGVDAKALVEALKNKSPRRNEVHLGHALKDSANVIIHHYDPPGVLYPHPDAGLALSSALAASLARSLGDFRSDRTRFPTDFSIDPGYELARAINHVRDRYDPEVQPPDMVQEEIPLRHEERKFCLRKEEGCAIYPRNVTCQIPTEEDAVFMAKKTLFAVKTCKKFHAERLSVIQDTWEAAALHISFFSEEAEEKYGTVVLPGVVNTPSGHCGKTEAILKHFVEKASGEGWQWLVIADDDTVLGVRKMLEQLWCYGGLREGDKDKEERKKGVHLGQRYGFRVASGRYGYDYITGGGGMVFDLEMAQRIINAGAAKGCSCPRMDTPDDMQLGACLANLGASPVHSARFHQGRPEDYHLKMLEEGHRGGPVSFHKHWNTNPRATYDKYFRESDQHLIDYKFNSMHPHQEL